MVETAAVLVPDVPPVANADVVTLVVLFHQSVTERKRRGRLSVMDWSKN